MYAELSLCCPLQPGMVTQESRGNETAVAFRPSAGMCTRIIVSVELVTSSVVDSSLSSAGVALVRSSLPTSRMFGVPAVDVVVGRADRVDPVDLRGEVAVEEPHHAAGDQHEHRQERRRHAQRGDQRGVPARPGGPAGRPVGRRHVVAAQARPAGTRRAGRDRAAVRRRAGRRGSRRGRPGPGRRGIRRRRGRRAAAAGVARRAGPGRAGTGRSGLRRAVAWVAGHGAGRTPAADRPSDRSLCAHRSATHLVCLPPPHARGTSIPGDVHRPRNVARSTQRHRGARRG